MTPAAAVALDHLRIPTGNATKSAVVQAHAHAGLMTFNGVPIGAMSLFVRALTAAKIPLSR